MQLVALLMLMGTASAEPRVLNATHLGTDRLRVGPGQALAWSPDGSRIATGGWGLRVEVHDAATGARLWERDLGFNHVIDGVAWAPDATLVAAGTRRGEIVFLNANDGTILKRVDAGTQVVSGVAFSKDGKRIFASTWSGSVLVFAVPSGVAAPPLEGECGDIRTMASSLDGNTLITGSNRGDVCEWSIPRATLVRKLKDAHHYNWVSMVSCSSHGFLTTGSDHWLRIWSGGKDRASGVYRAGLEGAAISPAGRLAWVMNGTLMVSKDRIPKEGLVNIETLASQPRAAGLSDVNMMAFSPDEKRLAVSSSVVRIFGVSGADDVAPGEGHLGAGVGIAFVGDALVSASRDDRVLFWESGHVTSAVGVFGDTVNSFAAGGGRMVTAGWVGPMRVYDARSKRQLSVINHGERRWVRAVAMSPGGEWVASSGQDGAVRIFKADTGAMVATPRVGGSGEEDVHALAFTPDGKWLLGGGKGMVLGWDARTGQHVRAWSASGEIRAIAVSPAGKHIAVANGFNRILLFAMDGAAAVRTWSAHSYAPVSLAFVDEERLASAGLDQKLRVWKVPAGELLFEATEHRGALGGVAVSKDGKRLATVGADGTVVTYALR